MPDHIFSNKARRQLNWVGGPGVHGLKYSFFYTCLAKYCEIKLRLKDLQTAFLQIIGGHCPLPPVSTGLSLINVKLNSFKKGNIKSKWNVCTL